MRIGIDARFWGLENTGIGRYVMELVKNLEKIDHQNQYVIFLRRKHFRQVKFETLNFTKVLADFPHYSLKEQFLLPRVLKKEKLDLVHFPNFNIPLLYKRKYVVTIHDLIKHFFQGPETTTRSPFFYWWKYLAYLLTVRLAVKRAKRIIVPSFWWKARLERQLGIDREKMVVTYEGIGEFFEKIRAKNYSLSKIGQTLAQLGIKRPYVIYVGNLYPHKNIGRLLKAIKKINQKKQCNLVIVSAKGVFWQRLKKEIDDLKISDLVFLAGFVSDRDLFILYRQAEAFIIPSLLEGFGLTGLEAMAVGLPVVSSSASCLKEVYAQAACYFSPKNANQMAREIIRVLEDKNLRQKLIKNGYERVQGFSFEKMARETLKVYESAL